MPGLALSSNPIFPATCGAAKLVPDLRALSPSALMPSTHCPRSAKSTSPCHVEKYVRLPLSSSAATVMGDSKQLGYMSRISCPSFPAAHTSGIPAATHASTASLILSASVPSDMLITTRLVSPFARLSTSSMASIIAFGVSQRYAQICASGQYSWMMDAVNVPWSAPSASPVTLPRSGPTAFTPVSSTANTMFFPV